MSHSSSKSQFATLFALNAVFTGICGGIALSYLPTASAAPRIITQTVEQKSTAPTTAQIKQLSPTIPQSTAVLFSLPTDVVIDAREPQEYSLVAQLVQPILNNTGNIVVPVNSPIMVKLTPTEKGAKLTVGFLIIQGRMTPVLTSSTTFLGQKISKKKAKESIEQSSRLYSEATNGVVSAVVGTIGSGLDVAKRSVLGVTGLSIFSGLIPSKKTLIVTVPQSSVHVLTLLTPVSLITTASQTPSQGSSGEL